MTIVLQHVALGVAAVVLDSLWQGALIAGTVWIGLRFFPRLGASTRYAIWFCALLALVVTPVLTVAGGGTASSRDAAAGGTSVRDRGAHASAARSGDVGTSDARYRPASAVQGDVAARSAGRDRFAFAARSDVGAAAAVGAALPAAPRGGRVQIEISTVLALCAALLWLTAVCRRGLLLLIDLRDVAAVRRNARLWSAAYAYPVLLSEQVAVPVAMGFRKPAVVLPAALVEQLDAAALDAIVVHEIAHLRRYDVWTNAIARIVQALLALNPAAWFVMRRLLVEREIACDDWVIDRTGSGETFARTLLAMASTSAPRLSLAAPSAFGAKHAIVVRIERLLDARPRRLRLSPVAFGSALTALALVAVVAGSISPVLAYGAAPERSSPAPRVVVGSGRCAVPNRGIERAFMMNRAVRGARAERVEVRVPEFSEVAAHARAVDVASVDLTVDARGKARGVSVSLSWPDPDMTAYMARRIKAMWYEPALRNCEPVASTMHTGIEIVRPEQHTGSVIVPVYPAGWSASHPSACKIPTVTHARYRAGFVQPTPYTRMLPAFPDAMKGVGIEQKFRSTVRVHVNGAGAATDAALVRSSGRSAFDDATLSAMRGATYPLTSTACKPLPSEYLVTTTFETQTDFRW